VIVGGTSTPNDGHVGYDDILFGVSDDALNSIVNAFGENLPFPITFQDGLGLTSLVGGPQKGTGCWSGSIAGKAYENEVVTMYQNPSSGEMFALGMSVISPPTITTFNQNDMGDSKGHIWGSSGFFAKNEDTDEIYAIGYNYQAGNAITVVKWGGGSVWHTAAVAAIPEQPWVPYAIAGPRFFRTGQQVPFVFVNYNGANDRNHQQVWIGVFEP
jgi:hypothetical protein